MATDAPTATTVSIVDQQGDFKVDLNLDLTSTTPQQIIDHLLNEGRLARAAEDGTPLHYAHSLGTRKLAPNTPLAAQGVTQGQTLSVLSTNLKGVND
jgi:hypothetical protein